MAAVTVKELPEGDEWLNELRHRREAAIHRQPVSLARADARMTAIRQCLSQGRRAIVNSETSIPARPPGSAAPCAEGQRAGPFLRIPSKDPAGASPFQASRGRE